MPEDRRVVRERVRRFRELRKVSTVTVTDVTVADKSLPIVTKGCNGCSLLVDLVRRVERMEEELSPVGITRRELLRGGGHSSELYGA
jgi:hypothetical protein